MNGMSREEIDGRFASSQATTDARIQALLERMDSVMVQSVEREARFNLQFDSGMEAIRDLRADMRDFKILVDTRMEQHIRQFTRTAEREHRRLRATTDAAVATVRALARRIIIAVVVTCVSSTLATVFGVAAVNASISSSMLAAIETGSNMGRSQEEFRRQMAELSKSQAQFQRSLIELQQSQAQFQRQLADMDARLTRLQTDTQRQFAEVNKSLRNLERRWPPAPPR